jgi:hypothetical protein
MCADAILSETRGQGIDPVAGESQPARKTIYEIADQQKPESTFRDLKKLQTMELRAEI